MSTNLRLATVSLLIATFASTMTGESGPKLLNDDGIVHSTKNDEVSLSVILPKKAIVATPLVVTFVIENHGKKPIYYYESSKHNVFVIDVVDARGKPVPRTRFGDLYKSTRSSRAVRREITPHEKKIIMMPLGRLFDLTIAGAYSVTIQRVLNEDSDRPIKLVVTKIDLDVQEPKD